MGTASKAYKDGYVISFNIVSPLYFRIRPHHVANDTRYSGNFRCIKGVFLVKLPKHHDCLLLLQANRSRNSANDDNFYRSMLTRINACNQIFEVVTYFGDITFYVLAFLQQFILLYVRYSQDSSLDQQQSHLVGSGLTLP